MKTRLPFLPLTMRPTSKVSDPNWWLPPTLLTDSPANRAKRAASFRQEAKQLILLGKFALGEDAAEAIWNDVAKKRRGGQKGVAHHPDRDIQLMYLYNCEVAKHGKTHGAKAAAVNAYIASCLPKIVQKAAVTQSLTRLLKAKSLFDAAQADWAASSPPSLLGSYKTQKQ